jgi:DNA-binding NarL/FixJ family response regulator
MGRMSSHAKIHVAVVDDHPVVRFGLSAIINLQGDMASSARPDPARRRARSASSGASTSS